MGYVPAALAREGEMFSIGILGRECEARVRLAPLIDPDGGRLRA